MTNVDGMCPDGNLGGSQRPPRAATMALTHLRNKLASVEWLATNLRTSKFRPNRCHHYGAPA